MNNQIVYNLIMVDFKESLQHFYPHAHHTAILSNEVQEFLASDDGIKPMPSDFNYGSNEVVVNTIPDGLYKLECEFNSLDIPRDTYRELVKSFPECVVSWKYEYYNLDGDEVEGYLENE